MLLKCKMSLSKKVRTSLLYTRPTEMQGVDIDFNKWYFLKNFSSWLTYFYQILYFPELCLIRKLYLSFVILFYKKETLFQILIFKESFKHRRLSANYCNLFTQTFLDWGIGLVLHECQNDTILRKQPLSKNMQIYSLNSSFKISCYRCRERDGK